MDGGALCLSSAFSLHCLFLCPENTLAGGLYCLIPDLLCKMHAPFLYKKLSYDDALETQNLSLTAELFCSIISMYVEILKLREL
jgi:hypothetical protein